MRSGRHPGGSEPHGRGQLVMRRRSKQRRWTEGASGPLGADRRARRARVGAARWQTRARRRVLFNERDEAGKVALAFALCGRVWIEHEAGDGSGCRTRQCRPMQACRRSVRRLSRQEASCQPRRNRMSAVAAACASSADSSSRSGCPALLPQGKHDPKYAYVCPGPVRLPHSTTGVQAFDCVWNAPRPRRRSR